MRLGLVTETFPPEVNGVAMTNLRLVRGLVERGHDLILIKPKRGQWGRRMIPSGVQVAEVPGCPVPRYPGLRVGIPMPGSITRMLRKTQPDIVHLATEGPLGWATLRAANRLGIPVTSTFHTNFQDYCQDYGARFLGQWMMRYLRWFHNRCALTTVPDHSLIERLSREGVERLCFLGRGADTTLFSPARRCAQLRASWGVAEGDPVAIYVGRVAAEKNIPLVLSAWKEAQAQTPTLRMVVVGDGPWRRRLQKRWPEVHFAGMRFDGDLATHYASADLFLFASESETFGNVVVEALASGLLVLTYDYAAGRQLIITGENGVTVAVGDASAYKQALMQCLKRREDWPKIRQAARTSVEHRPWSGVIDSFEKMLTGCRS